MNFQLELDKLRDEYLEEELLFKEYNVCVDFQYQEYDKLKKLLQIAYDDIANRFDNVNVMIDNLPFILKYTTANNISWVGFEDLYRNPRFIDKFVDALKYFPFTNDRGELFYLIFETIGHDDSFFNKKMFEELFLCGKDDFHYKKIFNKLSDKNKRIFLEVILEKKICVDFNGYRITGESYYYVSKYLDEFLDLTNDLFSFVTIFKNDSDCIEKINQYYSNHSSLIGKAIINGHHLCKYNDEIKELILLIVNDIINNREAKASDLQWLDGGAYSDILVIKDKVIKFGDDRDTEKFPNNPYIMVPLLRKKFTLGGRDIFIEVTELGDCHVDFSCDDCYDLYKKIRQLGLVAADMHDQNIAVLKKDNVIHWKGNLAPSDESLMLEKYIGNEVLKAGDIVLIDGDSIFREDDPRLCFEEYPFYKMYEARYQSELTLKKIKSY